MSKLSQSRKRCGLQTGTESRAMTDPHHAEIIIPRPGDLGGEEWRLTGLTNLVAVFGKNGSGKSRLLRAWRDNNPESTHYIIPERGLVNWTIRLSTSSSRSPVIRDSKKAAEIFTRIIDDRLLGASKLTS